MHLPETVSYDEWRRSLRELRVKEKAHMKASDALAAERRRRPMTEVEAPGLLELFEDRRQLLLYHFMFEPGAEPCTGCSMFTDQVGHLAHLRARDTGFAWISLASQEEIDAFRARMGWDITWRSVDRDFKRALGIEHGGFALQVLIRDGDRVFLTYETSGRGVEPLGSVWTFLDLTPLGRQEEWEDMPPGRPQEPPYGWWRKHDEYV